MPEHFCDLADLDYDKVSEGLIACTVCPRTWTLRPIYKGAVWDNNLYPQPMPHIDAWPLEAESILVNRRTVARDSRQSRLTELDRIAKDRAEQISETQRVFEAFQRKGGFRKVDVRKLLADRANTDSELREEPNQPDSFGTTGTDWHTSSSGGVRSVFTKVSICNPLSLRVSRIRRRVTDA